LYSTNEAADSDTTQPSNDETAVDDIDVHDIATDGAVEDESDDSNMDATDAAEQPLPVPVIQSAVQDCTKPIGPPGNFFSKFFFIIAWFAKHMIYKHTYVYK